MAVEEGITFRVAEVWKGDRALRTPIGKTAAASALFVVNNRL
ncbi:hypothetical protein [Chlorogloea sp. CCALA 695]|nr:hypothetical protein [Chlorogloea sp. CCALA 695]